MINIQCGHSWVSVIIIGILFQTFATIAVPLNRLLKNKVHFVWSPECEKAFKTIQDHLVAPPLLIHPEIGDGCISINDG